MVLFTGTTVEAAIEKGLFDLGLERSQAKITIVAKEKKGFLGFGKKLAQVDLVPLSTSVSPVADDQDDQVEDDVIISQPQIQEEPVELEGSQPQELEAQAPEIDQAPAIPETDDFEQFVAKEFDTESDKETTYDIDAARLDVVAYIENILYEMDLETTITVRGNKRQMILQIETPEPGRVIGYHGKVLKSLQLLAQNFLHDRYSRHLNVSLNVHDYLEHRMETLIDMAHRAANRVKETGRPYRLNPMTNSERKIIHKTISRLSGIVSYSEGDDPDRFVVVALRD